LQRLGEVFQPFTLLIVKENSSIHSRHFSSPLSIRRGQGLRFLDLHLFITAHRFSFTRFRTKHFSATCLTTISLTKLHHQQSPPSITCKTSRINDHFFISIGCPQH
jgi:hypothetical protein